MLNSKDPALVSRKCFSDLCAKSVSVRSYSVPDFPAF